MIRGLYTSAWSMLANTRKMDVISNNLANAGTNAYKKDTVIFESFPEVLTRRINDTGSMANPSGRIGTMELGSDVGEVFTFFTQGQLTSTNNRFDLALRDGNDGSLRDRSAAFFTVSVPGGDGESREMYTRDGAFTLRDDGCLVTKEGFEVMGVDGPIYLLGEDFAVQPDGTIVQGGSTVGKLLIKEFSDAGTLRKIGSNLYQATDGSEEIPFTGIVEQGYIEQSNIDIVREMVDMIAVTRSYEANQKIIQAQDETLGKAVNDVGAVR